MYGPRLELPITRPNFGYFSLTCQRTMRLNVFLQLQGAVECLGWGALHDRTMIFAALRCGGRRLATVTC